jgi:hypothetical protein
MSADTSPAAVIGRYIELARTFRAAVRTRGLTYEEGLDCLNLKTELECFHTMVAAAAAQLGEQPLEVGRALQKVEACCGAVWQAVSRDAEGGELEDALLAMELAEVPFYDLLEARREPEATRRKSKISGAKREILDAISGRAQRGPALAGPAVARIIDRDYDYTRRLLGELTSDGFLTNDEEGYHLTAKGREACGRK